MSKKDDYLRKSDIKHFFDYMFCFLVGLYCLTSTIIMDIQSNYLYSYYFIETIGFVLGFVFIIKGVSIIISGK